MSNFRYKNDVPRLIAGDVALELEGLTSKEPEHVGDREARLVVGRDGNINPVKRRVRVAEGNDGDVHVGSLSQGLVVKAGIANDHESGLQVPEFIIKYKLELNKRKDDENLRGH